MVCPKTQIEHVMRRTILAPTLSIIIPPIKGTIIFGNAYNEYNKLNLVYPSTSEGF
jgi:hypothetical protein